MILLFIGCIVLVRIFYSLAEIYFERDWPRHTWRGLMISLGLLLICCSAFGQAARVDLPLQTYGPNVPSGAGPLPQALWLSNVSVYACVHPSASLSACQASPITTYTDSTEGTTCPTTTQLVQLPGSTCTASAGAAANVGLWYQGGIFDYWVVASYGTFGPFTYNAPAAIGGNYVSKLLTTPQTMAGPLNLPPTDSRPVYVMENDFGGSPDGIGSLALLASAANQGLINLAAVIDVDPNYCGAQLAQAVLSYYNLAHVPVSWIPNPAGDAVTPGCTAVPPNFKYNSNFPDPVSVMRQVLVNYRNVRWITADPPMAIAALYNSTADNISNESGASLITQSIAYDVSMCGDYPSSTTEYNCHDVPSASQTLAAIGVPIYWVPFTTKVSGTTCNALTAGSSLSGQQSTNPVAAVYAYNSFAVETCDLGAAQYALYGLSYGPTTYFSLTAIGTNAVNSSGDNTFSAGAGNQYYLQLASTDLQYQTLLNTLLATAVTPGERISTAPLVSPPNLLAGNQVVTQYNAATANHLAAFVDGSTGRQKDSGIAINNVVTQFGLPTVGNLPIYYSTSGPGGTVEQTDSGISFNAGSHQMQWNSNLVVQQYNPVESADNVACWLSDGLLKDCGFASTAVARIANQSTNHGACWKTSTTLGYCSTAVDSSGNCTCN